MPKNPKPAFDFPHYEMHPFSGSSKTIRLFATDTGSAPDAVTIMVDHDDTDHALSEALAARIQLLPALIEAVEGMNADQPDSPLLKRLEEIDAELQRKRDERKAEQDEDDN